VLSLVEKKKFIAFHWKEDSKSPKYLSDDNSSARVFSQVSKVSCNLAPWKWTGDDFSTFFTWPLGHNFCRCPWEALILQSGTSLLVQKLSLLKDKYTKKFIVNIYFQWRNHVFCLQYKLTFPASTYLDHNYPSSLTKYLLQSKIQFRFSTLFSIHVSWSQYQPPASIRVALPFFL
jgi:hypothetical protein